MKYIKLEEYDTLQFQDLQSIVKILKEGGVLVFPTDSVYSMGCLMSNKEGIQKILKLTGKVEKKSSMSLIFPDLKSLSDYTHLLCHQP